MDGSLNIDTYIYLSHLFNSNSGDILSTQTQTFSVFGILLPVNPHPVEFTLNGGGNRFDFVEEILFLSLHSSIYEDVSQRKARFQITLIVVGSNFVLQRLERRRRRRS